MKNSLPGFVFTLPLSIFLICMALQAPGQYVVDRIPLQPGPEDMVLDTLHGEPALLHKIHLHQISREGWSPLS